VFYSTDPEERVGFITSLRELADFLASNPGVPAPKYGCQISLNADAYEDGGKAQVDHIARLLDARITDHTPDGHYAADRSFGRILYRAVSIPDAWTARRNAQQSYEDCISLDAN
jgi:hypothetical protein